MVRWMSISYVDEDGLRRLPQLLALVDFVIINFDSACTIFFYFGLSREAHVSCIPSHKYRV